MPTALVTGLGGAAGFGEAFLARNDDGSTSFIDLRTVFGTSGINFFGQNYTGLWLNNNGSVTFASSTGQYTPSSITGSTSNPIIAPFWADVDTRGGAVVATPGGTSTGTNLLWYDLDAANQTFTATWDDVGYFASRTDKLNSFQLSLTKINDFGDFDITFRYEEMNWTTGGASGGVNGLGGTLARAGYSSGNGVNYYELPASGNQAALLDLDQTSNVGISGTYVFNVRNGGATASLSVGDAQIAEGNSGVSYVVVPVYLSTPSAGTVTVQYATGGGSATDGVDYFGAAGTLTFAPGVTQQNVFIAVAGDTAIEGDETVNVTLSNVSGAVIGDGAGTITIVNDDGLSISDVRLAEGTGASPTAFTFTVSLLSASASAVTVDYATVAGTALAGSDFTPTNGTLTFAAGETAKTVTVNVAADSLTETDETFQVHLSNAANAGIARADGLGTILNDDGIVIDDARVVEGTSAGTTTTNVTIRLLSPAPGAVTVNWATAPGTATTPADFVTSSGTVTFAAGETVKTIAIPVVADSLTEGNETFQVLLSSPTGAAVVDGAAIVTIVDDDGFSVGDASVTEGNSGTTTMSFVVSLGSALASTATVNYATVAGTALAGSDYVASSGTLTFLAGETSKTVSVQVNGDLVPEGNEAFTLQLSNPSANSGIVRATGTGTIFNDDGLSINNATITEGNSGTQIVNLTVSLSAAATAPVTVNYATRDGTATAGQDYVAANGTLTFAPGETSKTIPVTVNGDTLFEGNETFQVVLSGPTNSGLVKDIGTITITNDDIQPPPSFSIVNAAITEGTGPGETLMRFQVALSRVAASASTVNFATSDGTALAGSDYTATTGTLTIPAGSLFAFLDVPITREALVEGNETLTVTLSSPSAGTAIGVGTATGTILNDDTSLAIAATGATQAEGQSGATPFTFTVTRTGDAPGTQSVDWAVSGAAVTGADFVGRVLPTGTVSFAAGETAKVVTVNVAGDTAVEANEAFTVTLANPSAGATVTTATATGTILNDDAGLAIAVTSAVKAEGQSGTTPFTFTVTRSGDTSVAHSANWAVQGASVTGADFIGGVLPTGTVSFAAGETSKVITVNVAGDTLIESNENFSVVLSSPSTGATFIAGSAVGTIVTDDASLAIAATSAVNPEGNSGTTPFTFTVTRAGNVSLTHSVNWAVSGAAVTGADFVGGVLPTGTVNFAAGETSKVITVNVAGDTAVESNEAFTVTLSAPTGGATLATASASGTINNDDSAAVSHLITFSETGYTVGMVNPVYTFADNTVNVIGQIVRDTAQPNSPAAAANTTYSGPVYITFANPVTHVEFDAGYFDNLGNTTIATIGQGGTVLSTQTNAALGIVHYTFDDAAGITGIRVIDSATDAAGFSVDSVSFSGSATPVPTASTVSIAATSASKAEGHSGSTPFTFTVSRTGDLTLAGSVGFGVTGSGTSQIDASDLPGLTFPSGTVSFAAGEASKVVTVNIAGDTTVESTETFAVTLFGASAGYAIGTASATGTVLNDDATLAITATSAARPEGFAGPTPFTFTVTRNGDTSVAHSATWAVSGAAVTGADFVGGALPTGTVNFAAGETSKVITINVAGDLNVETNEAFTVTLSAPSAGATIATASATGTIQNDDVTPIVGTGGNDTLNGTTGIDDIRGLGGNDTLADGAGNDFVQGGDGNDRITHGGGNDYFAGGAGDDTYVITGLPGTVTIEDSVGNDSIDASAVGTGFTLDLRPGATSTVGGTTIKLASGGASIAPLDLVFLQDLTGSFSDDIATVRLVAPQIVSAVLGVQPDTRFGVSAFADKAVSPFGSTGDYVYRTNLALTANGALVKTTYDALTIADGNDLPEAQIEALMQVALRPVEVGFRGDALRVVVLFTDATYHVAGDGAAAGILTPNNGDAVLDGTPAGTGEDYPGVVQVATALNAAGIYTVFAVTSGNLGAYTSLAAQLGNATAVVLTSDSSNIVSAVTGGLGSATATVIENAIGGAGNDTLIGNDAANLLTGNAGNDSMDGGAGIDTAVFAFSPTAPAWVRNPDGSYTVTTPTLGTDTLRNIEFARFDNGTLDLATGVFTSSTYALAATSASKAEGHSGATAFTFTVTRTGFTTLAQTMDWTVGGAAVTGADFAGGVLPTGTVSFAAGETSKVITINVAADTTVEGNEAFTVTLANPSFGAVLATTTATGTILNDDAELAIAATSAVKAEGNSGTTPFTFTVTRTGDTTVAHSANWAVSGAAVTGADFVGGVLPTGTVSFAAGETSKVITVNVAGDTAVESNEAFTVTLSAPTGGATLATASASGTINNDDSAGPAPIVGTTGADILYGTAGADNIDGLEGNDIIDAGFGDDLLVGGLGDDFLIGGAGIDKASYEGATAGVRVTLASLAPQNTLSMGIDTLVLIEQLRGSAFNDTLTGDGLANLLEGLAGNDALFGGAGADTVIGGDGVDIIDGGTEADRMVGGIGNDFYIVDNVGDLTVEVAGEGTDTVRTSLNYVLQANVENLEFTGMTGWSATGNALNNRITGGSLNDFINGAAGNDVLIGNGGDDALLGALGADVMTGGAGRDRFNYAALDIAANRDTITDFTPGTDRLVFAHSAYLALTVGPGNTLLPAEFVVGPAATTASQHLVYDQAVGTLYYDADGVGGAAQVAIAQLTGNPVLGTGDFQIL